MSNEFECFELMENIYQIKDEAGNCSTLVVGNKMAILFDTMIGLGDLKAYIEKITSLPLMVINSHGHFDHTGGNYQFDKVYLNRKDWGLLTSNELNLPIIQKNYRKEVLQCIESFRMHDRVFDITPGELIDLGGMKLEVISLPGHTAGSIGLLCIEKRILLAGDAFTPQMCLFFPESLSVEEYSQTLEYVMKQEFDFFVLGHHTRLFKKDVIRQFAECTKLPKRGRGYPFEYSIMPQYKGKLYILNRDKELGEIICIITK